MTTHTRIATADQVLAFLSGTKTQWREPITRRNSDYPATWDRLEWNDAKIPAESRLGPNSIDEDLAGTQYLHVAIRPHHDDPQTDDYWTRDRIYPRVGIGDVLRFRETWAMRNDVDPENERAKAIQYLRYQADGGDLDEEWHNYGQWRSSAAMPAVFSRLIRTVAAVRVEHVGDISEEDAVAEGFAATPESEPWWLYATRSGCSYETSQDVPQDNDDPLHDWVLRQQRTMPAKPAAHEFAFDWTVRHPGTWPDGWVWVFDLAKGTP